MSRILACALLGLAMFFPATGATLIHSYDFLSNVNDLVGTDNGVLMGGASVSGGVLALDGIDGYVQFATHLIPTGSYSVTFLAQGPASLGGNFEAISQGGTYGWYIGAAQGTGHMRASDLWTDTGVVYPTDGLQHQYALVVGGGVSKFFLDGALQSTLSSELTVSVSTGTDTRLGRQYGVHGEYLGGSIDDLRIYSGALSDAEVGGAVPEPSGVLLAAAGLCLLGIRRLRAHSN